MAAIRSESRAGATVAPVTRRAAAGAAARLGPAARRGEPADAGLPGCGADAGEGEGGVAETRKRVSARVSARDRDRGETG